MSSSVSTSNSTRAQTHDDLGSPVRLYDFLRGPINMPFQNFSPGDTTPSVNTGNAFRTANIAPTTITNFDDPRDGQIIVVYIDDTNTTVSNNANIDMLRDHDQGYNTKASLIFTYVDSKWRLVSEVIDELVGSQTLPDGDTSPSLAPFSDPLFVTGNTSPTSIVSFDDLKSGNIFQVAGSDANTTLIHGTLLNMRDGKDYKFRSSGDRIIFYALSTVACVEIARFGDVGQPDSVTFSNLDTTPEIDERAKIHKTANSSSTTITDFDMYGPDNDGTEITILFTDTNTTIQDNASMHLAGGANFTGSVDDILTLVRVGGAWHEKSRSIN